MDLFLPCFQKKKSFRCGLVEICPHASIFYERMRRILRPVVNGKKWGRSQIEIFSVQSPVIVYEKPRLRDKKYFAFGNLHVLGYMKDHPNELFSFDVYEFSSYKGLSAQDGVLNYLILTHILMPALQADGKFGATVLGSNGLDIFNSEEHLAVRVLDILQSQFGVVDKKSLSKILGIDSRGWNRIITTTGAGQ